LANFCSVVCFTGASDRFSEEFWGHKDTFVRRDIFASFSILIILESFILNQKLTLIEIKDIFIVNIFEREIGRGNENEWK